MRSIWSGSISFGLINIPIKLYSATQEHALNFDLLHKKDLSPIRYARVCLADGKEIPYKDIVKGYEYQKGEYVVIDENEFKKIDKEKTGTIAIINFVDHEEIDPIYFEKPYFLEPGKGADRAYALLMEALHKSNKVALVKYVFRNKEHLGILEPYENSILLVQMRFSKEIRTLDELKLPKKVQPDKKEIEMALKLINQLTEKFHPEKYHDVYVEELKKVIDAKVKGVTIKPKKVPRKSSKVHDISELLAASLEEAKQGRTKKTAKAKRA